MQTKLRIAGMLFAASLPGASLTSAATLKAKPHPAPSNPVARPMGLASWYGKEEQGRKMANGHRFDRNKLTAASWTLPLGAEIRVVNVENGKSVVVTVTDRGPNHRLHRILDLSEAAARQLDYLDRGLVTVFFSTSVSFEAEHSEVDSQLTEPPSSSDLDMTASIQPPPLLQ